MSNYTRLLGSEGSFDQMIRCFGVVTVMNAQIYEGVDYSQPQTIQSISYQIFGSPTTPGTATYLGTTDTLKIANINQEGPSKTVVGGQFANPLIKYGKTMRLEMQDALGNIQLLDALCGGIAQWKGIRNGYITMDIGHYENLLEPTTPFFSRVITVDGFDKLWELGWNGSRNGSIPVNGSYTVRHNLIDKMSAHYLGAFGDTNLNYPCIVFWLETGEYAQIIYKADNNMLYAVVPPNITNDAIDIYNAGTDPRVLTIIAPPLENAGYNGLHFGADFNSPKTIVGDTFFLNENGEEVKAKILIYQFLPDSLFNLTQDAEGDATVFDMNGDLIVTDILVPSREADPDEPQEPKRVVHGLFYSILDPSEL